MAGSLQVPMSLPANRSSVFEDDDDEVIEIKPPSELIPDEYERSSNANIVVHIFHTMRRVDVWSVECFYETLIKAGYCINEENIHNLEEESVDYSEVENKIYDEVNKNDKDGLIMIFSGVAVDDDDGSLKFSETFSLEISDVWKRFTTHKCERLKNKPKIFIFQSSTLAHGLLKDFTVDKANYDTPNEADMLIIYNKTDSALCHGFEFAGQVCKNIDLEGHSEDVISLVTNTKNRDKSRPLMISTLTRKFYFTLNETRDQHYYITDKLTQLSMVLSKLENQLEKKRAKRNSSFRRALRFFRNIGQNQEEEDKKEPKGKQNSRTRGRLSKKTVKE